MRQPKIKARPDWGEMELPLTLEELRRQLRALFIKSYRRFGLEVTRREFGVLSLKLEKSDLTLIEKLEWFERLDDMKGQPRPHIRRLVRDLFKEMGRVPDVNEFEALEKRIKNAKNERARIEAEFAVLLLPTSEEDRSAKYQVAKKTIKKRDKSKA